MKVIKFGGSSVSDSSKIKAVVEIILSSRENRFVVLSAMKGITNTLIASARAAEAGDRSYKEQYEEVETRTYGALKELVREGTLYETTKETLQSMLEEYHDILHGVELIRECSLRSLDLIMSFGERLNCTIVSAYMNDAGHKAEYIDAREIIRTDSSFGKGSVDFPRTYELIRERVRNVNGVGIITGFIASSAQGFTTTLGRNGSDYTASIIAAGVEADVCEIWTDVDGVLTADPRVVPGAKVIDQLSIEEAMELSFFGAEVIHPSTLIPTVEKEIPVIIRNTMNLSAPGTVISGMKPKRTAPITGIASIDEVALINVEGGGMIGMPGVASRIFTSLAEEDVNVIMISQASSEHSICIVCRQSEAERAKSRLEKDLADVIASKRIQKIGVQIDLELVAVIGDNMKGQVGLSGRLFSALGDSQVNILAIAQGSTEKNISLVIEKKQRETALNAIHRTFLES
ncbi:MAG: aspartate kinase [Spirochaetales bacterium]|nr:aspartate kinase [Spirochaetales bacterium]